MLSAQIAHVQLLVLEAQTARAADWTEPHLRDRALPWAEHVELSWATLSADERDRALAHARQLLAPVLRDRGLARLAGLRLDPAGSRAAVLRGLIANRHAPAQLRAAAVRLYASRSPPVSSIICTALSPARQCRALEDLASALTG
ncbi:hypothetical protein H4R18_001159 [Coemansia javaensis]|uniref:Uncharacterized protein n=1 Tax=Coemansia javaensis TaxID=2761396 RepID=A0A9W8HLG5_9FUNG|nr:hypothetical protein H4R18_001159 [Coemansia javaensis]